MDIGNNKTSAESIMQSLKESDIPQDIIDSIGTAYAQNGFSDLVDALGLSRI